MPDPSWIVTGGGGEGMEPPVYPNGNYTVSGTYNGKDSYSNGYCTLRWAGGAIGWEIVDEYGTQVHYSAVGPNPDSGTWYAGALGEDQPPTVTAWVSPVPTSLISVYPYYGGRTGAYLALGVTAQLWDGAGTTLIEELTTDTEATPVSFAAVNVFDEDGVTPLTYTVKTLPVEIGEELVFWNPSSIEVEPAAYQLSGQPRKPADEFTVSPWLDHVYEGTTGEYSLNIYADGATLDVVPTAMGLGGGSAARWNVQLTMTNPATIGVAANASVRIGPFMVSAIYNTGNSWTAIAQVLNGAGHSSYGGDGATAIEYADLGTVNGGAATTTTLNFTITTPGLHIVSGLGSLLASGRAPAIMARERTREDRYYADGLCTIALVGGDSVSHDYAADPQLFDDWKTSVLADGTFNQATATGQLWRAVINGAAGGGVNFQGIDGAAGRITNAGSHYEDSSYPGDKNWDVDGGADYLACYITEVKTGEFATLNLTHDQCFWGDTYLVNFSKLRCHFQQPNELWPSSQPSELDPLIWGFRKVPWLALNWPQQEETANGQTGAFADGDPCPVLLSDLVGLTDYIGAHWSVLQNRAAPDYWDTNLAFCTPPYSFSIDAKWARDNHVYLADGETRCYDHQLTIDTPGPAITDGSGEPWSYLGVSVDEVDIDKLDGERVTAWVGATSGGAVGSSDDVVVTTTDAGATITRDLKSNLADKIEWVQTEHSWPDLPNVYLLLRQNAPTCTSAAWPLEDACCWNFGYLRVRLIVPAGVSETDVLALKVIYQQQEAATDNHLQGIDRILDSETGELCFFAPLSDPITANYEVTGLEAGTQDVYFGLMLPKAAAVGPRLEVVNRVELTFPALTGEKTWTLKGMWLTTDPEGTGNHFYVHDAEDFRHNVIDSGVGKTGGFRGRIDNCSLGVLGNEGFNLWEKEPVLGPVKWILSEDLNTWLERAYTLVEYVYLLNNVRNGVTFTLNASETYADGAGFDLASVLNWEADADGIPFAARCGAWQPVPGVEIVLYAQLIFGGAAETVVTQAGAPLRDGNDVVAVTRREAVGAAEEVAELDSDEHGVAATPYYLEPYDYTQEEVGSYPHIFYYYAPVKYTYYLNGGNLGELYRRQVRIEFTRYGTSTGRREVGAHTEPNGVKWSADVQGNNLYAFRDANAAATPTVTTHLVDDSGLYDGCGVTGDGATITVFAHNSQDDKLYRFLSRDQGTTWTDAILVGA